MALIREIFERNNLEAVEDIEKINAGFTNEIYIVNGKYILKVCKSKSNEKNFEKEVYWYRLFKGKIPVPDPLVVDISKTIMSKYFMVYKMIPGETIYSQWHLLNDKERRNIVRQMCPILRKINNTPYDDYLERFEPKKEVDWHKKRYSNTKRLLRQVSRKKIISSAFAKRISDFIEENHEVLQEQKLGLVYWDVHFDNFIVRGNRIVGIIDFEDIDVMSIDYTLDSIRRTENYPHLYASEELEKYVKKKDYSQLMKWFRKFYPELFEFKDLNKRLDLYSVEYDLRLLLKWSKSKDLKRRLGKAVGFKVN